MNTTNEAAIEPRFACGFEGNNDLYGLGLRIGLYIQYLTLFLANIFEKESDTSKKQFEYLRGVVLVYVLANFIAMVRVTQLRSVYACEIVILLLELVPQLVPAAKPRTKLLVLIRRYHDMSSMPAVVLFFVIRTLILYQAYFWWRGIDLLPLTACNDEFIWFFVRVRLRGWFRIFCRFAFLILGFGAVIDTLYFLYESTCRLDIISNVSRWLSDKRTKKICLTSTILIFIFSVAGIEMTIRWNNISGVYRVDSTGQLLPLLVSMATLSHVLYALFPLER